MAAIRYDWRKVTLEYTTPGGAREAHAQIGGALNGNRVTIYRKGSSSAWLALCERLVAEMGATL